MLPNISWGVVQKALSHSSSTQATIIPPTASRARLHSQAIRRPWGQPAECNNGTSKTEQSQGQELSKPSAKEGGKVYTPYQLSPGLHDSTAEQWARDALGDGNAQERHQDLLCR